MPPTMKPTFDSGTAAGPGTFGLVIGASRYPHLADGDPTELASQSYDLRQLAVSALTAYRFYRWIEKLYRYDQAPLAKCWVLLSPTADELVEEPALATFQTATMANCVAAIIAWEAAIKALHPTHGGQSRTVFFFSGHGIEREAGMQLLLPSDYLCPPAENLNEAIRVTNLVNGLRGVLLREDFFFLDACRSNPPKMANLKVEGRLLLKERAVTASAAGQLSPVLSAVNTGGQAWQPLSPPESSYFGEALLGGLGRPQAPGWPSPCGTHSVGHLELFDLILYVHDHLVELLLRNGLTAPEPVRIDNGVPGICVTTPQPLPPPTPVAHGIPPGPLPVGATLDPAATSVFGAALAEKRLPTDELVLGRAHNFGDFSDVSIGPVNRGRFAPLIERVDVPPAGLGRGTLSSWLWDVFRSERWSAALSEARATPLGEPGRTSAVEIHEVRSRRVPGKERALVIEIDLSLAAPGPHWLELQIEPPSDQEKRDKQTVAIVLPGDLVARPRFTVELFRDDAGVSTTVVASLAGANEGILGGAGRLWKKYAAMRIAEALAESDRLDLGYSMRSELQSPLAGLVAGLVLVKAGRWETLSVWLRDLSEAFPELPDPAVLCIEQRRRLERHPTYPVALIDQLLRFESRTLPFTIECMALLADQVREALLHGLPKRDARSDEHREQRHRLLRLRDRLAQALRLAPASGLFAVLAGPLGKIRQRLVLPRKQPVGAIAAQIPVAEAETVR